MQRIDFSEDSAGPAHADSTAWLLASVYEELRRLAYREMRRERGAPTLQPTALVHEAYLRLSAERSQGWENRAQFFRAAATAMRRILVDRARRRRALRHGGGGVREALDPALLVAPGLEDEGSLLELDLALEHLKSVDPELHEVVSLRAFAALTIEETAAVLGSSARSVRRDWETARLFLFERIRSQRSLAKARA